MMTRSDVNMKKTATSIGISTVNPEKKNKPGCHAKSDDLRLKKLSLFQITDLGIQEASDSTGRNFILCYCIRFHVEP